MKKRLRWTADKVESILHKESAKIIGIAKEYKSEIVFEAIADMKQHGRKHSRKMKELNYTLSLFDYAKFAQLVYYKANRERINVFVVDPANTSKTCNKCFLENKHSGKAYTRGIEYIYKGKKRKNSKIGICTNNHGIENKQGSQIDADLNAARVIALCKYKGFNNPRPFGIKPLKRKI